MNKKGKVVLKKHRKKKESRRNNPKSRQNVENWIYAIGRIREDELPALKEDLKSSELGRLSTVSKFPIDAGYLRIQIMTRRVAATILEASLADGILRFWGNKIKIGEPI